MVLIASAVGVRHGRHWIFRDLDVTVASGQLVAVTGPHGSGRTSALLALTGHLKHTHGTVDRPGTTALGLVRGVHEPEPMLTAREHLEERARLLGRRLGMPAPPPYPGDVPSPAPPPSPVDVPSHAGGDDAQGDATRWLRGRAARRGAVDNAVARLPFDPNILARDLSPLDRHLLMIEMAALNRPDLIAVDDFDLHLSEAEQKVVLEALLRDGRAALITARYFPDSVELAK